MYTHIVIAIKPIFCNTISESCQKDIPIFSIFKQPLSVVGMTANYTENYLHRRLPPWQVIVVMIVLAIILAILGS